MQCPSTINNKDWISLQHQIKLQQSLKAIYGDVGVDQLKEITDSIGFREIMQCPTAINDNYNLILRSYWTSWKDILISE